MRAHSGWQSASKVDLSGFTHHYHRLGVRLRLGRQGKHQHGLESLCLYRRRSTGLMQRLWSWALGPNVGRDYVTMLAGCRCRYRPAASSSRYRSVFRPCPKLAKSGSLELLGGSTPPPRGLWPAMCLEVYAAPQLSAARQERRALDRALDGPDRGDAATASAASRKPTLRSDALVSCILQDICRRPNSGIRSHSARCAGRPSCCAHKG